MFERFISHDPVIRKRRREAGRPGIIPGPQRDAALWAGNDSRPTDVSQRGIALLWSVAILPVLIGFMGLAIDIGYLVWVGERLRVGADAAALAAAMDLPENEPGALQAAVSIAGQNYAAGAPVQLANTDVVFGYFNRNGDVFTPNGNPVNAAQVTARRTAGSPGGSVSLLFGPALGFKTANIQRSAIAMTGNIGAGVLILNPSASSALSMTGTASITVQDGLVQVDSNSASAATFTGHSSISAASFDLVGGYTRSGSVTLPQQVIMPSKSVADPLAALPFPTPGSDLGTVSLSGKKTATLQQGYYSGGISLTGQASVTCEPGIYILGGVGLSLTGGSSISAQGVIFCITGTGAISLSGSGSVNVTPPTTGTYQGVSIFQNRTDTNTASVTGTSSMDLTGTYYFPSNAVTMTGTSNLFGNQWIANTLSLTGTSQLQVNYNGNFPSPGPPFLVQ